MCRLRGKDGTRNYIVHSLLLGPLLESMKKNSVARVAPDNRVFRSFFFLSENSQILRDEGTLLPRRVFQGTEVREGLGIAEPLVPHVIYGMYA